MNLATSSSAPNSDQKIATVATVQAPGWQCVWCFQNY